MWVCLHLHFPQTKYFWTNKETRLKILDKGTLGTGKLEGRVSAGRAGTAAPGRSLVTQATDFQKFSIATLVCKLNLQCIARAVASFLSQVRLQVLL